TLCFLVATLRIANWTMLPLLVMAMLFGAYAVARWREQTSDSRQQTADSRRPGADSGRQTAGSSWSAVCCPLSAVSIAIIFLCAFIAAQAPPASLDELA